METRLLGSCAALLLLWSSPTRAEVITLGPGTASTITDAVRRASPGDVIRLEPGTYEGTVVIDSAGEPERPITIESAASDPSEYAVLDGGASPGRGDDFAIRFAGASWITVRNLVVVNAWENAMVLEDSTYVSIQGCEFRDTGRHAVAVFGDTHHVLVEGSSWTQDERVWTEWSWDELHHGSLDHYNGGFYGAGDGLGGAVIRRNTIRNAFNGIRWRTSDGRQTNLEIYENEFQYVLDNMIEPEDYAWNVHAYHNVMNSCASAPFSIQGGVKGGHILLYGNVGRWQADGQSKQPWTIYKLDQYRGGNLIEPLSVLHNSFQYRTVISSGRGEDYFHHFNNAYTYANGDDGRFGMNDWEGRDTRVDHDCSALPFGSSVESMGLEENGVVGDPQFTDPTVDDYSLSPGSPCIDAGRVVDGQTLWYLGAAPDSGAYEGSQLVSLAPMRHVDPPGGAVYVEKPRIARIFSYGHHLVLFYTTDLEPGGVTPEDVDVSIDGRALTVGRVTFPSGAPRVLVVTVSEPVAHRTTVDLSFTALPRGANGEGATLWAADRVVVQVPLEANLVGELASALDGLGTGDDVVAPDAPGGGDGSASMADGGVGSGGGGSGGGGGGGGGPSPGAPAERSEIMTGGCSASSTSSADRAPGGGALAFAALVLLGAARVRRRSAAVPARAIRTVAILAAAALLGVLGGCADEASAPRDRGEVGDMPPAVGTDAGTAPTPGSDTEAPGDDDRTDAPAEPPAAPSAGCEPLPDPPGDVIVNLAEEGLSEGEEIDPYLAEHLRDGVELHIPAGRYEWNGGGDGNFDDASIVGDGEVIFDASDGYSFGGTWSTRTQFEMRNVTIRGVASAENGKFRFAATAPDAVMTIRNLHMPDGAAPGRRVGIRVNPDHAGELWFIDPRISNFPNNAIYGDNPGEPGGAGGAVHVRGGFFHNNNIAAVRIGSDDSSIIGTVIVNDGPAPAEGGRNQRGIRIREEGFDILIEDVNIHQAVSGTAIEIDDKAGDASGSIRNVRIRNDVSAAPIRVENSGTWTGEALDLTGDGRLEPSGGSFDLCTGAGCTAPDLEPWPTCR